MKADPGSALWAIIRREYLERVRNRWFVVATLAFPLVVTAALVIGPALSSSGSSLSRSGVALSDATGRLAAPVTQRLAQQGIPVRTLSGPTPADSAAGLDLMTRALDASTVGAWLVLDAETLTEGRARIVAHAPPAAFDLLLLRQAVVESALEVQLGGDSPAVRRLLGGGELSVDLIDAASPDGSAAFLQALVGSFLLYMTVLIHAVAVMRAVLEEKTNRVVEILLSAVRPFDLMMGKIVGVGAVGLTQIAVWATFVAVAAAGLGWSGSGSASMLPQGAADSWMSMLPGPGFMLRFGAFFVGGYFIYAGLYAAVGALCTSEDQVQQAQLPVTVLLLVPVALLNPVLTDPTGKLAVVTSLIPLFTPVLLFARTAATEVPTVQVVLGMAGMLATVPAIAWAAGRIYRHAILATGRSPWRRVVGWIRSS